VRTRQGSDRQTLLPSRQRSSGGTETILLVEDYDGLREMIATTLRTAGYTVLGTGKPEAAPELVAKQHGPITYFYLTLCCHKATDQRRPAILSPETISA